MIAGKLTALPRLPKLPLPKLQIQYFKVTTEWIYQFVLTLFDSDEDIYIFVTNE